MRWSPGKHAKRELVLLEFIARRMALAPGSRVAHYEIGAPIGAGGIGEVYRARDARLNREVRLRSRKLSASFVDTASACGIVRIG